MTSDSSHRGSICLLYGFEDVTLDKFLEEHPVPVDVKF